MADTKGSSLTALTASGAVGGDFVLVIDTSAGTAGSKKMSLTELTAFVVAANPVGVVTAIANNATALTNLQTALGL